VTTLLLARHGETDWNAQRRFQGHADPPLNDVGRAQARALAARVADAGVGAVYSSDLRRAAETADIVGDRLGLSVSHRASLREIDVGEWSGHTVDEIVARFPDGYRRHREGGDGWDHGESHAALSVRIVEAVVKIAGEHPGETILVVAHGACLRALLAYAEGIELGEFRRTRPAIENGSLATVVVEDGTVRRID
jgi:2,3-bisphosphoglycerate-dependent phosphoglycerate mutase